MRKVEVGTNTSRELQVNANISTQRHANCTAPSYKKIVNKHKYDIQKTIMFKFDYNESFCM